MRVRVFWRKAAVGVVVALSVLCAALQLYKLANGWNSEFGLDWRAYRTHLDFNHVYGTSFLIYDLGDSEIYGRRFDELAIADDFVWHQKIPSPTNPPSLALILAPLAALPRDAAWWLWTAVVIATGTAAAAVVFRALSNDWALPEKTVFWLMIIGDGALALNIVYGQVQTVIMLLVVLGWVALRRGRDGLCGIAWGLSFGLKFYTWPLLALLLVLRRKRAALAAGIAVAASIAAPMVLISPDIWLRFFHDGMPIIKAWAADGLNVGLIGSIYRGAALAGVKLANGFLEPVILYLIPLCLFPLLVFGALGAKRQQLSIPQLDLAVAVTALFSFFVSPTSWQHYLVAVFFCWAVIWTYERRTAYRFFIVSALWLLIPKNESSVWSWLSLSGALYWTFTTMLCVTGLLILGCVRCRKYAVQRGSLAGGQNDAAS